MEDVLKSVLQDWAEDLMSLNMQKILSRPFICLFNRLGLYVKQESVLKEIIFKHTELQS